MSCSVFAFEDLLDSELWHSYGSAIDSKQTVAGSNLLNNFSTQLKLDPIPCYPLILCSRHRRSVGWMLPFLQTCAVSGCKFSC